MEKLRINMIGGGFQHINSASPEPNGIPKYVEWSKQRDASVSMYIDNAICDKPDSSTKNYAWLAESSAIIEPLLDWVRANLSQVEENFEYVFTHDRRLLPLSDKFKFTIANATPWVTEFGIHKKSRLVSMIASSKKLCPGHFHRHTVVEKYKNEVDLYGTGQKISLERKEDGLRDYYFSVAMENDNYPTIFCEKLTDCMAMGTIPIYWGAPDIGDFFNQDGIIMLTDDFRVDDLSPDLYYSKMDAIKDNYERAITLMCAEDYIYTHYL